MCLGPTDSSMTGLGQQEAGSPAPRMRERINNRKGAQEGPQHCLLSTGVSVTPRKLVTSLGSNVLVPKMVITMAPTYRSTEGDKRHNVQKALTPQALPCQFNKTRTVHTLFNHITSQTGHVDVTDNQTALRASGQPPPPPPPPPLILLWTGPQTIF